MKTYDNTLRLRMTLMLASSLVAVGCVGDADRSPAVILEAPADEPPSTPELDQGMADQLHDLADASSRCADGTLQPPEQCDDGNTVTEACPYGQTSCTVCAQDCVLRPGATMYCGDGVVNGAEQCDDGNTVTEACPYGQLSCIVCTSDCMEAPGKTSGCGDGVLTPGEGCDDGNQDTEMCAYGVRSCTVCDASCAQVEGAVSFCGDGVIDGLEECDDGNQNNQDACTNACLNARCGDGIVGPGESCDDGNQNNQDACTNACRVPTCGDGIRQPSEQCDDGNQNNQDACTNACLNARCGDGIVGPEESCDDGNTTTEPCPYGQRACVTCSSSCSLQSGQTSFCGDGIRQPHEQCDDGNTILEACAYGQTSCVVCDPSCQSVAGQTAYCGDGLRTAQEVCDGSVPLGATCEGLGFAAAGLLSCNSSCALDLSLCGDPTPPPIFFSEYIEDRGAEAIELFNNGSAALDLGVEQCAVLVYSNGNTTPSLTIPLSGSLAAKEAMTICRDNATGCDLTQGSFSPTGNDAIVLRCSGGVVDVFGRVGEDPGVAWTGGGLSTRQVVLRRSCAVMAGDSSNGPFDPSAQWEDAVDDLSGLGQHCPPSVTGSCWFHSPLQATRTNGDSFDMFGRLLIPGLTDLSDGVDPHPGLVIQLGIAPDNTPTPHPWWRWYDAQGSPGWSAAASGASGQDEYTVRVPHLQEPFVSYDYLRDTAMRVSLDGGVTWNYCDADGSANGYLPASAGSLRIQPSASLLVDINPGPGHAFSADRPQIYQLANQIVIFLASSGAGQELWRTDGTSSGTYRLGGAGGPNNPQDLTLSAGKVFYRVLSAGMTTLGVTDGTQSGTRTLLTTFNTMGAPHIAPGGVYFVNNDSNHGLELWFSDGTTAGTKRLSDIKPGAASGVGSILASTTQGVFFRGDDGVHGWEPWFSDGTSAGTRMIADLNPGSAASSPSFISEGAGGVFLEARDAGSYPNLWFSDGAAANTRSLLRGGYASTQNFKAVKLVGDTLYFIYTKLNGEHWLAASDGTVAGTKDLLKTSRTLFPVLAQPLDGRLLFANPGSFGFNLWVSDGTPVGTRLLAAGTPSSLNARILGNGGAVYRSKTNQAPYRTGLWRTDGTPAGTRELTPTRAFDLYVEALYYDTLGAYEYSFGELLGIRYFWRIDPMSGQLTPLVSSLSEHSTFIVHGVIDGLLYFSAGDHGLNQAGAQLWVTDGTAQNTWMIDEIPSEDDVRYKKVFKTQNGVVFIKRDPNYGDELWVKR